MEYTPEEQAWFDHQRAKQVRQRLMDPVSRRKQFVRHVKAESPYKGLPPKYREYIQRANAKGRPFELSIEQFDTIRALPCTYCGNEIGNGIDRIDPALGYTTGNSQSCCPTCNMMKHAHTHDFFVMCILKIASHLTTDQIK